MKSPGIVHYQRTPPYVLARFWKEREREQDEVTGVRQSESGRQPLQKVVNSAVTIPAFCKALDPELFGDQDRELERAHEPYFTI